VKNILKNNHNHISKHKHDIFNSNSKIKSQERTFLDTAIYLLSARLKLSLKKAQP
jgi:hypothetical protein